MKALLFKLKTFYRALFLVVGLICILVGIAEINRADEPLNAAMTLALGILYIFYAFS